MRCPIRSASRCVSRVASAPSPRRFSTRARASPETSARSLARCRGRSSASAPQLARRHARSPTRKSAWPCVSRVANASSQHPFSTRVRASPGTSVQNDARWQGRSSGGAPQLARRPVRSPIRKSAPRIVSRHADAPSPHPSSTKARASARISARPTRQTWRPFPSRPRVAVQRARGAGWASHRAASGAPRGQGSALSMEVRTATARRSRRAARSARATRPRRRHRRPSLHSRARHAV